MSVRLELAIGSGVTNGGTIATGMLQLAAGIPLDTTLRAVTDQANTVSPLQLSTTQVGIYYPNGTFNGGLSITGGADGGSGTTSFVDFIPNKSTPTYYHAIGFAYDNSNWLGFYRGSRASAALAFGNNLIWTPSYNVAIGHTSASARLHVRGDGTNPIARFENNSGNAYFQVNANGSIFILGNAASDTFRIQENQLINVSSGTITGISYTMSGSFASGAGSANFRPINVAYTINNSGAQSGTATGIFINSTQTALNGMVHNFFDLQKNSTSVARIDNDGAFISSAYLGASIQRLRFNGGSLGGAIGYITGISDGVIRLTNNAESGFSRLQFGGTSNLWPSLKPVGNSIEVRLADDTAYSQLIASSLEAKNYLQVGSAVLTGTRLYVNSDTNVRLSFDANSFVIEVNGATAHASSIFTLNSTLKGFLPPRMTTAQKTAITTPAAGLVVYDTTLNKLCVYTTAWETITSV